MLNFKRGMTRLWVVASALWLACVIVVDFSTIHLLTQKTFWGYSSYPPTWQTIETSGDGKTTILLLGKKVELDAKFQTLSQKGKETTIREIGDQLNSTDKTLLSDFVSVVALALLTPPIILVLGMATGWAIAGFVKRPGKGNIDNS